MNTFTHVPPGFRFHPTDEELVDYYLRKKIAAKRIDLDVIKDVDLYRIEPWDLTELCRIGSEEQNEWYFFSHKDKKYPTGTRTNRATKAGFWKATGRDKAIYSKHSLIGMRKTLVFYKGRAPNGQKSDWIMHEYRLETNENATPQEEGWVVCRVFKKRLAAVRKDGDHDSVCWYDDQVSFMPDFDSPRRIPQPYTNSYNININPQNYSSSCKQELDQLHYNHSTTATTIISGHLNHHHHDAFLQLPQLESPKIPSQNTVIPYSFERSLMQSSNLNQENQFLLQSQQYLSPLYSDTTTADQVTDWRVLDKFVASQLSHEDAAKQAAAYSDAPPSSSSELASMATTSNSSQVDLWK